MFSFNLGAYSTKINRELNVGRPESCSTVCNEWETMAKMHFRVPRLIVQPASCRVFPNSNFRSLFTHLFLLGMSNYNEFYISSTHFWQILLCSCKLHLWEEGFIKNNLNQHLERVIFSHSAGLQDPLNRLKLHQFQFPAVLWFKDQLKFPARNNIPCYFTFCTPFYGVNDKKMKSVLEILKLKSFPSPVSVNVKIMIIVSEQKQII